MKSPIVRSSDKFVDSARTARTALDTRAASSREPVKDSPDHSGHNPEKHEGGNETRHQAATHCVEDLSAVDRRALTEMLVDKVIIARHPSKID